MKKTNDKDIQINGTYKCPTCEKLKFMVIRELGSTAYGGVTPDGFEFNLVIRHAVECSACKQRSVLMRYTNTSDGMKD